MKLNKLLTSTIISAMLLTTAPFVTSNLDFGTATVEAAKGGAKLSLPKSAPKPNLNKTPNAAKTPAVSGESKSVSGGGKEYAPSKSAKDLSNGAPAAKSNVASNAANTGSFFGNALRNIGIFAGGMMLGGLIASLFGGFGGGFLSDILGLLFNVIMIYAAYRGIRYLWNKFRGNNHQSKTQSYSQPIDITPPQASNYPNPSSIGMDYDSKRAADHYRSL